MPLLYTQVQESPKKESSGDQRATYIGRIDYAVVKPILQDKADKPVQPVGDPPTPEEMGRVLQALSLLAACALVNLGRMAPPKASWIKDLGIEIKKSQAGKIAAASCPGMLFQIAVGGDDEALEVLKEVDRLATTESARAAIEYINELQPS